MHQSALGSRHALKRYHIGSDVHGPFGRVWRHPRQIRLRIIT